MYQQASSFKFLKPATIEKLTTLFGDLAYFENKKIFHTALVTTNGAKNLDKLYIMNKTDKTPSFPDDWFMFLFMRAFCDASLTSVS